MWDKIIRLIYLPRRDAARRVSTSPPRARESKVKSKSPVRVREPDSIHDKNVSERQSHSELHVSRRSCSRRMSIIAAGNVGVVGQIRRSRTEAEICVIEGIHQVSTELQFQIFSAEAELLAQREIPFVQS